MSGVVAQHIRERLSALDPKHLDVIDESALHAGHPGAAGGAGHYRLIIVSARFDGMNMVARHRLIYQTLGDLMEKQIHALTITAFTQEEV